MNQFNITNYTKWIKETYKPIGNSTWIQHVPFAYFLIQILKPSSFAELGVYLGVSYFSFCQMIKSLNLNTKCYGIDTWQGDQHAGFYDDSLYDKLLLYQKENGYESFSTLLKMNFDAALNQITDKSLDLLHIDGLHTYEAVKHDFETWLPKMSDKGVIIFHDTMVRERDFGVWKLWDEISTRYPSYNFAHGYGLGIIAVGNNVNQEFIGFLEEANKSEFYQDLFLKLGYFVEIQTEFLPIQQNKLILILGQKISKCPLLSKFFSFAYRILAKIYHLFKK